jgi:hypothetical protein
VELRWSSDCDFSTIGEKERDQRKREGKDKDDGTAARWIEERKPVMREAGIAK